LIEQKKEWINGLRNNKYKKFKMKYFITLLLVVLSHISIGQMTLLEFQKVYNMDFDQFEAFALRKGYHFDDFDNNENINGISYVKGLGNATKYLILHDKYFNVNKNITYQTRNTNEILSLKAQLKSAGFQVKRIYFDDNSIKAEEYRNKSFEFIIYTLPPGKENNHDNVVGYELVFRRQEL